MHGKYQGRESKAEIIIREGILEEVRLRGVRGKRPLEAAQLRDFEILVNNYSEDIVRLWIDYFVLNLRVDKKVITRRIR